MNTASQLSDDLRRLLREPTGGFVGLVDELLAMCVDHRLELDWRLDRCRVRAEGGPWEELTDLPMTRSVFRAVIARIANLCNDSSPIAVSPYGGEGELVRPGNPRPVVRVAFVNTPAEQELRLACPPT